MTASDLTPSQRAVIGLLSLFLLLLLRLVLLGEPAIVDPSESRFAVGAQQMLIDGDWIMPKIYENGDWTPFWSKPPLQYWLVAVSYKIFGMNDWSARFPGFIALCLLLALLYKYTKHNLGKDVAVLACLLLASCPGMFYFSATCLSDATLSLAVAGAVFAFYNALTTSDLKQGRWVFIWLGIGMLTKGPVTLILFGAATLPWLLWTSRLKDLRRLPWILGLTLFILITAPWYIAAEIKSPGFNKYFFLYENFLRYFSSNFVLKYGTLHKKPYGSAWPIMVGILLPWTLCILALVYEAFVRKLINTESLKNLFKKVRAHQFWSMIFAWMFGPMLVLTFARQFHPTYLFPIVLPFAVAIAKIIEPTLVRLGRCCFLVSLACFVMVCAAQFSGQSALHGIVSVLAIIFFSQIATFSRRYQFVPVFTAPLVFAAVLATGTIMSGDYITLHRSTREVFEELKKQPNFARKIAFLFNNPLSSQFYGRADSSAPFIVSAEEEGLKTALISYDYIVIKDSDVDRLAPEQVSKLKQLSEVGIWRLFSVLH